MGFKELRTEDRRLVILRLLDEAGATTNDSILQDGLGWYGHKVSRDLIRTDLRWLCEMGLVTIEELPGVLVAALTERGADVATGRATVPGVKRRGPGA